jgi:hypothetical protein
MLTCARDRLGQRQSRVTTSYEESALTTVTSHDEPGTADLRPCPSISEPASCVFVAG